MSPKLLILLIILPYNGLSQKEDSTFFTKLKYRQGVSFKTELADLQLGLDYNYNNWFGLGYRHYQSYNLGLIFRPESKWSALNGKVAYGGFEVGVSQNARFSLRKPIYFSMYASYYGLIALGHSNYKLFDDYINGGRMLIGLSGFKNRFRVSALIGAGVQERKQDLFYSVHTYAAFYPNIMIQLGFFFDKKKD